MEAGMQKFYLPESVNLFLLVSWKPFQAWLVWPPK